MISHGYECTFLARDGSLVTISRGGFSSSAEAASEAFDRAKRLGYSPPKWWQFWRRGEAVRLRASTVRPE